LLAFLEYLIINSFQFQGVLTKLSSLTERFIVRANHYDPQVFPGFKIKLKDITVINIMNILS